MFGSIFHFAAKRFQLPFQLGRLYVLIGYRNANLIQVKGPGGAERGRPEGRSTPHFAPGVIAPYFFKISTVRSIGNARTVCPLPVTVTARSSEL